MTTDRELAAFEYWWDSDGCYLETAYDAAKEAWTQAALRRSQPEGEMVMVPRDQFKWNYQCPSEARECEARDFCAKHQCCGRSGEPLLLTYALTAAAAEGRKCGECGSVGSHWAVCSKSAMRKR